MYFFENLTRLVTDGLIHLIKFKCRLLIGTNRSAKNYLLNGILFRTHSTQEEFEENIKKLNESLKIK